MANDRDDDMDDRPSRRNDDDAPRRRRRDDDDEPAKGGMDGFLGNMGLAILMAVIGFCIPCVGIILGGIGLGTTKTPEGKRGSMIVLIAGVVGLIVGIILRFTVLAANAGANNNF